MEAANSPPNNHERTMIVLHGSRQTGDLLLGRMEKLRKRLTKLGYRLIAPTGPLAHPENKDLNQWWEWKRGTNHYEGFLQQTLPQLMQLWKTLQQQQQPETTPVGFLGFSQGARLAQLLTVLHEQQPQKYFDGLQFVIMVAGYDAPTPDGMEELLLSRSSSSPTTASLSSSSSLLLRTRSLHVWGLADGLITPDQSERLAKLFQDPIIYTHEGGHHVPMRANEVQQFIDFIQQSTYTAGDSTNSPSWEAKLTTSDPSLAEPDEETKQVQQDEVEAMAAIFPEEFKLLSPKNEDTEEYTFPIRYQIALPRSEEGVWPPRPLYLHVSYPPTYPHASGPLLSWVHDNNVMEFSTAQREACAAAMHMAAQAEEGMPCVYSCYTAAKDFFESGAMMTAATSTVAGTSNENGDKMNENDHDNNVEQSAQSADSILLNRVRPCSQERAKLCNQQGLDIAASILKNLGTVKLIVESNNKIGVENNVVSASVTDETTRSTNQVGPATAAANQFKGGYWTYTIGLVGKPSAGKSTFFNAATAFARQRDDDTNLLGGATMAPHPFTTIDANLGFCLVPAPKGLCPEDDLDEEGRCKWNVGSTHGRDPSGRRFLPVLLKDVAGLVPGAYQGRGRGNKFLNDLTDADVLVHVLDASGTADVEGNDLGVEEGEDGNEGQVNSLASHPLQDMEWIRKELIEWVYANLMYKWESVAKKGRSKLMGMFSGYGQSHGMLWTILNAVEKFLEKHEQRDNALDNIHDWDEGDVRRVVSAFLGVRFPMALALNKSDLPTSKKHIADIQRALPIHGAYIGTPLCARQEMLFMKRHLEEALLAKQNKTAGASKTQTDSSERVPMGVWSCLTSAMSLHEPILVFPVTNFTDYAPLPGLNKYATGDPSLPNVGMVACLEASGGKAPSLWDPITKQYSLPTKRSNNAQHNVALRDAIVMKPGSTVDDVFIALKNRRVLEGEFVRAEAAGQCGAPSRPVPKHQPLDRSNRILKIMTTKKTSWQQNYRA